MSAPSTVVVPTSGGMPVPGQATAVTPMKGGMLLSPLPIDTGLTGGRRKSKKLSKKVLKMLKKMTPKQLKKLTLKGGEDPVDTATPTTPPPPPPGGRRKTRRSKKSRRSGLLY